MKLRYVVLLAPQPARFDEHRAPAARRVFALLVLCALLASCGARVPAGATRRPIDVLRERAEDDPDDVELAVELAIAEHFEDGGDPERARSALARAKKLGAKGLALTFVEAEEQVLEGRPAQAFASYVSLIEQSARGDDPLSAAYAEVSLAALSDMNDAVDDYRARVEKALEPLLAKAQGIGLNATHQLRMQLYGYAQARGDLAAADALARDAGCVRSAEVAGPFGPRELLGFDQKWPAEAPGPFKASYDLGPGRGVEPVRKLETRRCVLALGRAAHDALPGTHIVRSELEVRAAGAYALRVESPNSLILWLDGKEILRLDLRGEPPAGVRYLPIDLSAGKHELRAKVTSRHPNPALSLALVKADLEQVNASVLPEPRTALERYLVAKLSLARGDPVGARELLRTKGQAAPSAHFLVLESAAALADPLRPPELRRDLARELLRKAAAQNDRAWYPAVGLANLEAAEGHLKEAIEALRAAVVRFPEVVAIRTSLIEQLRERGYVEEAERSIAELKQRLPHACAVSALELSAARQRGRVREVEKYTNDVMKCDAASSARFTLLKAQRKYGPAAEELLRLRSLGDVMDPIQELEAELDHARVAGDAARERALREKRSELWSDRPEPVLDAADMLLAQGKRREAVSYLETRIGEHPDELYDLRRVEEALGAEELFHGYRKDGDALIRAFEQSGRKYSEPQVLVLDYTVVRLFEDGSSVDLTHNIMRVQSQEAVDENGEFSVPDGARLLKLHTIKADGRKLEPDAISGKSTLSLPNLAPGDYLEFEFVRGESPSAGFPGGYLGNRFYFQSFEVPFDHSELVVLLPKGAQPVIDPRGPVPETIRKTEDGLTVLRWVQEGSRPLSPEPLSVSSREYIPSINLGMKVTWDAYVDSLRDILADKDMVDPAARAEVQGLLGDDARAPASVRAEKLYRWVIDQIEPTEEVFGMASSMLASRTGSRERVLRYMLKLAGVESALLLARGVEADHSDAKLPDPETYGYLLLRIETEQGPKLVSAAVRHAPFGYLPPQIRGEEALVLSSRPERVRVPASGLEDDLRSVEVDVRLLAEGSAQIHVRETHRGPSAITWRNDLDEIPAAELEARFEESYAANVIPGAKLKQLAFEARDRPDEPLVIDYSLEVDRLGHRVGKEQRIAGVFPSSLAGQYARIGTRETTELVAPSQALDVRVHFELPKGARLTGLPKASEVTFGDRARFVASARGDGQNVTVARSLRVPIMRVTPDAYVEFSAFCRGVDLAEAGELAVELP